MSDEAHDATGRFEGYASVFNVVDRGRDMVLPGAFQATLKQRGPTAVKFLWQHDPREPIGILEDLYEDRHGLFVRGRLLMDVERAREAHGLMKAGALDGLSIGFHTIRAERGEDGTRRLRELDLWEISLVTFPMNDRARVFSFKDDHSMIELAADQAAFLAGLRHLTHLMTQER
ncbi:HK97 family phage prohead protease [Luteithermobacter gelatinilyticus]|uniref:HK97 family phage prohead protease n=1 Tax=Luteithermobacter gelatinilyticus TaxID=2582913 RepID=UPI0011067528|nr:HK97 family phage prohead protease [Luteithermobacter gelatinilyticus]|tara:strand:+ start:4020 stop:4541 length:522 start_codon:yes stop_codon:yes gene_type:complete